ncbi:MAG: hypothetical protein AAGB51_07200 [Planctomycetota bacterium]
MSSIVTDEAFRQQLNKIAQREDMADTNVRLTTGSVGRLGNTLSVVGAVLLGILAVVGLTGDAGVFKHAVAAYQVGVMAVLAIALGSLFWVMVFEITSSSWHATIKRQWLNIAAQLPVILAMIAVFVVIELTQGGLLLTWLDPDIQSTYLIAKKAPYLNVGFFLGRLAIYAFVWIYLSRRFLMVGREQDATGDRWLSQKVRFMSGWGLLLFALTTTFAAFDLMMSMDYRFFSTMWGVYYFAGAAGAGIAMLILVLSLLKRGGKLQGGICTEEHFADLGKMLFAFSVFWAYIAYSQYFLIWYSNIPEETAWFVHRKEGGWENLGFLMIMGRFILPFLLLLFRPIKRNRYTLPFMAGWVLFFHVLDMVYIIRPMVFINDLAGEAPGPTGWFIDLIAIGGVFAIFLGGLCRQITKGPLIAVKDPRLPEALHHKNYVS